LEDCFLTWVKLLEMKEKEERGGENSGKVNSTS